MDWVSVLQSVAALIFVLALIVLVSVLLRHYGNGAASYKPGRLQLLESRRVDTKYRMILLACDETEYVMMVSNQEAVLLDKREISAAKKKRTTT